MELQIIQNKIFEICGQQVMFDFDLAGLYGFETRALNQAVKRNCTDFMFQLSKSEFDNSISQNVISSWGGLRYLPSAFVRDARNLKIKC